MRSQIGAHAGRKGDGDAESLADEERSPFLANDVSSPCGSWTRKSRVGPVWHPMDPLDRRVRPAIAVFARTLIGKTSGGCSTMLTCWRSAPVGLAHVDPVQEETTASRVKNAV